MFLYVRKSFMVFKIMLACIAFLAAIIALLGISQNSLLLTQETGKRLENRARLSSGGDAEERRIEHNGGLSIPAHHITRANGESGAAFVAVVCWTRTNGESGATLMAAICRRWCE